MVCIKKSGVAFLILLSLSIAFSILNFKKAIDTELIPNLTMIYRSFGSNLAMASDNDPHGGGEIHEQNDPKHEEGHMNLGEVLPLWSCIPFALMLFSIALFPLVVPEFWHHHFGKISAF